MKINIYHAHALTKKRKRLISMFIGYNNYNLGLIITRWVINLMFIKWQIIIIFKE